MREGPEDRGLERDAGDSFDPGVASFAMCNGPRPRPCVRGRSREAETRSGSAHESPSIARILEPFIAGPDCIVGRREDCHIRPESPCVSRLNFGIRPDEDGRYCLEDGNSRYGTEVNLRRVEGRQRLRDGDLIQIPSFCWRFLRLIRPARGAERRRLTNL